MSGRLSQTLESTEDFRKLIGISPTSGPGQIGPGLLVIEASDAPGEAKDVGFKLVVDLSDEERGLRIAADGDDSLVGGQVPHSQDRVGVDVGRVRDLDKFSIPSGSTSSSAPASPAASTAHAASGPHRGLDHIRPKQALD